MCLEQNLEYEVELALGLGRPHVKSVDKKNTQTEEHYDEKIIDITKNARNRAGSFDA